MAMAHITERLSTLKAILEAGGFGLQALRGQEYQISTSGQTVVLGAP